MTRQLEAALSRSRSLARLRPVSTVLLLLTPLAAVPLHGCGGGQGPRNTQVGFEQSGELPIGFRHPYFPLLPGVLRVFEGELDGQRVREEIQVMEDTEVVWGTLCAVVVEHVYVDDQLAEITAEWFGLDAAGNIWKFGEESLERDGGELVRSSDSWVVGIGDAMPWVAFPASPRVGDIYYGYTPDGPDEFHVLSLNATAAVFGVTFENCLEIIENPDDEDDTDIILYAPGVGRVSETTSSGNLELVASGKQTSSAPIPSSPPARASPTSSTTVLWPGR